MLPVIPKLLKLQERDQRLTQLIKDLARVPKMQAAARDKLSGDQAAVEKATSAVQEVELAIKDLELEVGTREATIKRLQDQQFETRKNDEFRAFGVEIERYQAEVSGLEDKELEQMERLDAAKADLDQAKQRLETTQGQVNDELAELEERAAGMERRKSELEIEREGLTEPIESEALDLYDRIFKKKGDAAVVPLKGDKCGGCHVKVVVGTIQSLKQEEQITQCDSCGRILYLAE